MTNAIKWLTILRSATSLSVITTTTCQSNNNTNVNKKISQSLVKVGNINLKEVADLNIVSHFMAFVMSQLGISMSRNPHPNNKNKTPAAGTKSASCALQIS